MILLGNFELKPLVDGTKTKEKAVNMDLIYG